VEGFTCEISKIHAKTAMVMLTKSPGKQQKQAAS
jgi:hypothetical protein